MKEGGFLGEDCGGFTVHFKEPSFTVKREEATKDRFGFTGQADVGGAMIGNRASGGELGEVVGGNGGEFNLAPPAVDVG